MGIHIRHPLIAILFLNSKFHNRNIDRILQKNAYKSFPLLQTSCENCIHDECLTHFWEPIKLYKIRISLFVYSQSGIYIYGMSASCFLQHEKLCILLLLSSSSYSVKVVQHMILAFRVCIIILWRFHLLLLLCLLDEMWRFDKWYHR